MSTTPQAPQSADRSRRQSRLVRVSIVIAALVGTAAVAVFGTATVIVFVGGAVGDPAWFLHVPQPDELLPTRGVGRPGSRYSRQAQHQVRRR